MELTATTRLEIQQIYKLLQFVRNNEYESIVKLTSEGIPSLINYREPQDGDSALHLASVEDNDKMIKFLIGLDANPNVQDIKGRTPLMRAAEQGHHKTVEVLAKNRANMRIKDAEGRDILNHCLSQPTTRHRRCLDIALSYGGDANTTEDSAMPSLVFACTNSVENETMCLMIVETGGNPNVFEKEEGKSALHCACLSGSELTVRALLQAGADPNYADLRGRTPFHHAAKGGHVEACKALSGYGADATIKDERENSAIHMAAEVGATFCCNFLFTRGADPLTKNKKGFSPQSLAKEAGIKGAFLKSLKKCEKGHKRRNKPLYQDPYPLPLIKLYDWMFERQESLKEKLLKRTIPEEQIPNLKGNFVWKSDMQEFLMYEECPFPQEFKEKFYNLHDKDRMGIVEIDELLSGKMYLTKAYLMPTFTEKVKKAKGKGKKGKGGKAKKGKTKVPVPICVEGQEERRPDGGPPPKYVEKQALATDCTRFNRDEKPKHEYEDDSAWYLQKADKQYVCITEAVKLGDVDTVKDALASGTPVDIKDRYYKTALMVASAEGNAKLVEFLLSLGASTKTKDNFKWTPLHHACNSGQVDVVHMLLIAGADGNAQTWNGATPLMRAVQSGKFEVVEFLLDCNVNVTLSNKKNKTVVDVAAEWAGTNIYNMVKTKYDSLPIPKGKGKEGEPPPSLPNKPLTIPPLPGHDAMMIVRSRSQMLLNKPSEIKTPHEEAVTRIESKMNVLNNSIANNTNVATPLPSSWARKPSSEEVYRQQHEKRARYGNEIDFDDFKMPLKKNIDTIIEKSTK